MSAARDPRRQQGCWLRFLFSVSFHALAPSLIACLFPTVALFAGCPCYWTAFARTTGGVGEVLRAALDAMVKGGALPMPRAVTAAPPGKDLLEWWDSVSLYCRGAVAADARALFLLVTVVSAHVMLLAPSLPPSPSLLAPV